MSCFVLASTGAMCTEKIPPVGTKAWVDWCNAENACTAVGRCIGCGKTAELKKVLEEKWPALSAHPYFQFVTLKGAAARGTTEEWNLVTKYVKDDAIYSRTDDSGQGLLFVVGHVNDQDPSGRKYSKDGPEIARFLVEEKKLDVNGPNKGGTPLHYCLDPKMVDYLISKGADVNAKDKRGYTPLMAACGNVKGTEEAAIALIEHGADPSVEAPDGYTALFLAAMFDHSKTIPALLKALISRLPDHEVTSTRYVVDTPMSERGWTHAGYSALCFAVLYKKQDSAKALIKCGADVNYRVPYKWNSPGYIPDGRTAIFIADAEMTKLLIGSGADVNAVDACGYTPLYTAAGPSGTDSAKVELLLAAGANPFPDSGKATPYQFALKRANQAVIAVFRKYHADVVNPNKSAN